MEHPKRFVVNQCTAYGKDHRRCRLERGNNKTCHIHRNYYTNWLIKNTHLYPHILSKRKVDELVFQYKMVDGVENYVRNLHDRYIDFFIFLVFNTDVNPLWNTRLFSLLIHNAIIMNYDFSFALKSIDACKYAFSVLLSMTSNGHLNPLVHDEAYVNLWDKYFVEISGWKQMMGSTFFMIEYETVMKDAKKNNNQHFINVLEGVVLPAILTFKKNSLYNQKYGLTYKEELMMVTWHPSRVEKWLKNGGMELCDMMMGV